MYPGCIPGIFWEVSAMVKGSSRIPFTQDKLVALACPPSNRPEQDGRLWVRDTKVPGLAFCVTEGGARTFYLYRRVPGRKSPAKIRLGTIEELNVERARRRAGELNSQIASGRDPMAEKVAARIEAMKERATIGNLWASYQAEHLVNKRPDSIAQFTRLYNTYISRWKLRPLDSITAADVEALKTSVAENGQYVANRVLELLGAMFRRRGHAFGLPRGQSPTTGVEPFPEKPRDRVLSVEELARVLKSIEADEYLPARDYFKMLLFTGQRKNTVARMTWQDLDIPGSRWKIPGEKTKNGRPLVVALTGDALEIIKRRYESNPADSPYVFPARRVTPQQVENARGLHAGGKSSREIAKELRIGQTTVMSILSPDYACRPHAPFEGANRIWKRILKRAGITQHTVIHDVRRSFCTFMIERGIPLPIVSAAMGHRSTQTTAKHYAFASDKTIADATGGMLAGLLADVAKIQSQNSKGPGRAKAAG
jgi:integrase